MEGPYVYGPALAERQVRQRQEAAETRAEESPPGEAEIPASTRAAFPPSLRLIRLTADFLIPAFQPWSIIRDQG